MQDVPPAELITGNRIASMDTFNQQMVPHLQCPACRKVGQLVARADDEFSCGLAGTVALFCLTCDEISTVHVTAALYGGTYYNKLMWRTIDL